jgi:pimeloyl-ACP methyl ester carboxylesterase
MFRQVVGRPTRMSAAHARQALVDMGTASGFRATLRASLPRAYVADGPIEVPVSVSFGTRDCLLLAHQSRHLEQLPTQTRLQPLRGTGHVPMTDDLHAVAGLIERTAHTMMVSSPVISSSCRM